MLQLHRESYHAGKHTTRRLSSTRIDDLYWLLICWWIDSHWRDEHLLVVDSIGEQAHCQVRRDRRRRLVSCCHYAQLQRDAMTKYRCTADATKVRCEVGVGFTSVLFVRFWCRDFLIWSDRVSVWLLLVETDIFTHVMIDVLQTVLIIFQLDGCIANDSAVCQEAGKQGTTRVTFCLQRTTFLSFLYVSS